MADWEEIKRLAADFQRTQTSDTLQRISERNCIDIVKKLTDLGLIELIYTCDGKEFITPDHLLKEIEDEVYVNGGRMQLHDLASTLNVDYQHVEYKAKELAYSRPADYSLILGQVIHSSYKNTLAKQIYDTMISYGQLSIAEFSKSLDLPSEFLISIVKETLPALMDDYVASADERTYYTTDMVDRYKAIIAGTLSAITKPTTIASIMKRLDIPEKMFIPTVDGLIKEGRIDAVVENRLFIPAIYAREQNEWIDRFYQTNSYIEYDLLSRRDIKQPKSFLRKRFPDGIQLKSCLISPSLMSQVESMVEECITSNSLMDISTIVPAAIQADDIEQLLQEIFKRNKQFSNSCLIIHKTNICSLGYIATCKESFSNMMSEKAKEHLKQGKLAEYFLGSKQRSPRSRQQSTSAKEQQTIEPNVESDQKDKENKESEKGESRDEEVHQKDTQTQEQQQQVTTRQKIDPIELTAEDLKRERRMKKGKNRGADESLAEAHDSDEKSSRKTKGASRKSGGAGTQGREIKQKVTKKKYLAGKNKRAANDDSDEELQTQSVSSGNKSRSAKRGVSPPSQSNQQQIHASSTNRSKAANIEREPLEFMTLHELIEKLKVESRDCGDFSDETFDVIASDLIDELNKDYLTLARQTLDDHLRSSLLKKGEDDHGDALSGEDEQEEIDLVE